jgi:hypothetical protein
LAGFEPATTGLENLAQSERKFAISPAFIGILAWKTPVVNRRIRSCSFAGIFGIRPAQNGTYRFSFRRRFSGAPPTAAAASTVARCVRSAKHSRVGQPSCAAPSPV